MAIEAAQSLVLVGLFELAQQDRTATVIRLGAHTQLERRELLECLARLDAAGYVDRERLSLTLPGLALAVALAPSARRLRRSSARAA